MDIKSAWVDNASHISNATSTAFEAHQCLMNACFTRKAHAVYQNIPAGGGHRARAGVMSNGERSWHCMIRSISTHHNEIPREPVNIATLVASDQIAILNTNRGHTSADGDDRTHHRKQQQNMDRPPYQLYSNRVTVAMVARTEYQHGSWRRCGMVVAHISVCPG